MIKNSAIIRRITGATHRFKRLHILGAVGAFILLCALTIHDEKPQPAISHNPNSGFTFFDSAQVNALTDADAARYKTIFKAQKSGQFDDADNAMLELQDQRLMGTVLADRYLNNKYATTSYELEAWLNNYADQPEANRIAHLAAKKGVTLANTSVKFAKPKVEGIGRVDTIGNSDMPKSWFLGLRAWKEGNDKNAAQFFADAASNKELSNWQQSAAYFWQYRASARMGNADGAYEALNAAAMHPLTFYGMIAQNIKGGTLRLMAQSPYVPDALRSHGAVLRAKALSQIGQTLLAERELRTLFKQLDESDRSSLITLSSEMNLPNLQVRLSRLPELNDEERIFANYPMPQWLDAKQLRVDNALLLAISRQESSFSQEAQSHAGASGLMQLMPKTANYIFNKSNESLVASINDNGSQLGHLPIKTLGSEDLNDPKTNLLLGQEYVQYLAHKPFIGNNIVHILASYNAGPGIVYSWNKTAANIKDPLLYIESIPYTETRHYVMQVLANYWAYESLMGKDTDSLFAIAQGKWPEIKG